MTSAPTVTGAADLRSATDAAFAPVLDDTAEHVLPRPASIPLDERIELLTGATAWTLRAIPAIGLRSLVVSDGPVGVRGTGDDPDSTSLLFPAPSAVAATWDPHVAVELGRVFAREARAHGVDVVLAPQINIQRTPVAGRHFECFSEDPLLTSAIASSLIGGMQEGGVAATLKHYVANDSETDRTRYTSRVGEQALREVYLAPFEHAVRHAGVWCVMAAYSGTDVAGHRATMTEHFALNVDLLKREWGFDGVLMSDWLATTSTVASALGGLDLVMPGPGGPWGHHLAAAVSAGEVPEAVVDDKVTRILRLAERTGALGTPPDLGARPIDPGSSVGDRDFVRRLAARSMVVLRRETAFPIDPRALRRIAVLGPNAVDAYVLGGGSSHVTPTHVVTPAEGIAAAAPGAEIVVRRGGDARRHLPALDQSICRDPRSDAHGIRVTLLAESGAELSSELVREWSGWLRDLDPGVDSVRIDTVMKAADAGRHAFDVGTIGRYRIELDGAVVAEADQRVGAEVVLDSSVNSPDGRGGTVTVSGVTADEGASIRLTATLGVIHTEGYGHFVRAELRHRPPGADADAEIADAVAAAADAELTIVIVGTNDEVESEGWDRESLALPGRQDELVERVLEVAPDAIVVVNAGAPVLLPWLERARTVIWAWFPGQECGDALADVVFGATEPAGRLPWTLPARETDLPVPHGIPGDDLVIEYSEGVHVGYRGWQRAGRVPARDFGFGLGWTDWRYDAVDVIALENGEARVRVEVTNTGDLDGTEVVQVYLEAPDAAGPGLPHLEAPPRYDRPVRWLAGFGAITVASGRTSTVTIDVPRRSFEVWDVDRHGWVLPPGPYRVVTGRSVSDIRLTTTVLH